MAKVTLEKRYQRYRDRIHNAKRQRQADEFDDLWERLVEMYSGRQFQVARKEDQITVNVAFATVNVIGPSISVNHPKTTVLARDQANEDRAVITEAVLDYWWKAQRFGIKPEFRLAVKDFLIVGHGWLKTGYKFSQKEVPLSEDEYADQFAQAVSQAGEYAAQNPELSAQVPTDQEIAASLPDTKLVTADDRPFVERVSFFDMYVDPEATSLRDARWIAQRIVRPLEDAKDDERYEASVRNKLTGETNLTTKWTGDGTSTKSQGDDVKRVIIWEFYDLSEGTMSVFSENVKGFLAKPRKMPYDFGHPFVMIRNYDVPNQFYPMGDLEALEPLQNELNKTRSQLMNMRSKFARKILYRENDFDPSGRSALESKYDMQFVPVLDSDKPLNEVVFPITENAPAPQLYDYSAQIQNDIDVVTGVSDYQRGAAPEVRRTATEASLIQDAVNARSADKLSIVEECIANVGANLQCLARQYLTGQQVARVVGPNAAAVWVPYEHDDLDFDADFEVEGGSTMPKNETFRQNQAMQLMTAMQPFVGTFISPEPLIRFVLQNFGIKNPEQFIMQPQIDPMTGQPVAPGMAPPGAPPGGGPPPGQPEVAAPGEDTLLPGGLDPQVLAQLAGQVGLNIPRAGP